MIKHNGYLLVQVPRESYDFNCVSYKTPLCKGILLTYLVDNDLIEIDLPPGTYQLIGLAAELTEEQWRDIVIGEWDGEDECWYYRDYKTIEGDRYPYSCADISGLSLLLFYNAKPSTTVIIKEIKK